MENVLYNIWSVRDDGDERALVVCRSESAGRPEGQFIKWLGSSTSPNYQSDVVQRELSKVYSDSHPLKRGSIARTVRDKLGVIPIDNSARANYWFERNVREVIVEVKRRRNQYLNIRQAQEATNEAIIELLRI